LHSTAPSLATDEPEGLFLNLHPGSELEQTTASLIDEALDIGTLEFDPDLFSLPSMSDLPSDRSPSNSTNPSVAKRMRKRSAAKNAAARIRTMVEDTELPLHFTIKGKSHAESPRHQHHPRRTAHHNLDVSLPDAALAEQVLGIDAEEYSSLPTSQRNVVASAKYRQKKLNQLASMQQIHQTLRSEFSYLKAELAALEDEIAQYRTFSKLGTAEYLD
jgi:hypothetical protein